ncbi:hypothetical protein OsccyDRAFT_0699 [Leptolyngbyaceae cyanobacterium JSC-12]|nr:hypothetical protein OsccyDRAFT_0699 [Leptolyngbyaceae cyanobacterium JSC-12]
MTTSGYLQGQASISTTQKITDLRTSDQATAGLSASVIPPGDGQAQVLPNPNTYQIYGAQPLPQFSFTSFSDEAGRTLFGIPQSITTPNTNTVNLGEEGTISTVRATRFEIRYTNVNGSSQLYLFSLPPAIETNLRSNTAGASVPEVKPGILIRTSMNYKRFLLPGGSPAYQSLGVEQTMIQLVGLFIGVEGNFYVAPGQVLYGKFADTLKLNSAYQTARRFDEEVVQSAREVDLFINSESPQGLTPISINYRCILRSMRLFVARHDRVYYALDAEVTTFKTNRISPINPTINSIGSAVSSITQRPSTSPQSNPAKP